MKKLEYIRPAIKLLDTHQESKLMSGSGPSGNDNPTPGVGNSTSNAKGYGFGSVWDDDGTEIEDENDIE